MFGEPGHSPVILNSKLGGWKSSICPLAQASAFRSVLRFLARCWTAVLCAHRYSWVRVEGINTLTLLDSTSYSAYRKASPGSACSRMKRRKNWCARRTSGILPCNQWVKDLRSSSWSASVKMQPLPGTNYPGGGFWRVRR